MKTKYTKKSMLHKILTVVGTLVIVATIADLSMYAFDKLKDPTRCTNEEALRMVGSIIERDLRKQYDSYYPKENLESSWYNDQYKADAVKYDFHLQEFNYLDGDKKSCLGVAYFTNGASSNYEYKIFYDKKNNNLSVQTYSKPFKKLK